MSIKSRWLSKATPFFSVEFFPPKTEPAFLRLLERAERLSQLGAAWMDVTWSAFGSSADRCVLSLGGACQ
jgi:methylenetetrahydrofolate reductase (NADPH)